MMFALSIPGLEPLGKAFAYALHWLSTIAGGNYGIAIILLTVLMRIIILPLSIKQTKSMIAMQKLQPQLKEIQKKYKDDREKQGQEMMALYKENKVSPLGGCLPLLLQLPIIFAVFEVLRSLADPKSKFFNILFPGVNKIVVATNPHLKFAGMNITYKGSVLWSHHNYVQLIALVILTVITGYMSSKMMTTDPKQAKMMALMPVMMGVFAWILPAGVTIYIIVTNIFTIVQQYIQLEHDGFFDEELAEIRQQGAEAKWHKRAYLKGMSFGTKAMFAIHMRKKPVELVPKGKASTKPEKKQAAAAARAGSSKAVSPAKGKVSNGAAKKPAGPGQKKSASGKKASSATKKPSAQGTQRQAAGKKPKPPSPATSGSSAAQKTRPVGGKATSPPEQLGGGQQAKRNATKNYPAKKKGTGKK